MVGMISAPSARKGLDSALTFFESLRDKEALEKDTNEYAEFVKDARSAETGHNIALAELQAADQALTERKAEFEKEKIGHAVKSANMAKKFEQDTRVLDDGTNQLVRTAKVFAEHKAEHEAEMAKREKAVKDEDKRLRAWQQELAKREESAKKATEKTAADQRRLDAKFAAMEVAKSL